MNALAAVMLEDYAKPMCCGKISPERAALLSRGFGKGILSTIEHILCKTCQSSHSKIDKTKALKTNGTLTQVRSIAECSLGAFCNTFDLH